MLSSSWIRSTITSFPQNPNGYQRANTYHSIFSAEASRHESRLQLDFKRFDLRTWSNPDFYWSSGQRAAFAESWLAYGP